MCGPAAVYPEPVHSSTNRFGPVNLRSLTVPPAPDESVTLGGSSRSLAITPASTTRTTGDEGVAALAIVSPPVPAFYLGGHSTAEPDPAAIMKGCGTSARHTRGD
jgi:hypothetical protein